LAGRCIVSPP